MLKVLLKKQLMEVFKGYFFDTKKNKTRSKSATIAYFILFAGIMIIVLGGMFTFLSVSLCSAFSSAGFAWLYFLILSGISILLGAFGSVFNTFSGLYLGKDNNLLLSMPIPVKYIIISRLMNVYFLGFAYSAVVSIPAVVVYWIFTGATVAKIMCGIVLILIISLIVLILSCLLGWCVAKISLKLKNKSIITVFIAIAFIAVYYLVYFKAQTLIEDLILNVETYGEKIRSFSSLLYAFGCVGEGNIKYTLIIIGVVAVLLAATWLILKSTFLSIANSSESSGKVKRIKNSYKQKPFFRALLNKEFKRFASSPNYMLNCGFGIIMIPIAGVVFLLKGASLYEILSSVFASRPGSADILICTLLLTLVSMINPAAPSVSLEGKSIWLYQSLPIDPKYILRAKSSMQFILSAIPMVFAAICLMLVGSASVLVKIILIPLSLAISFFNSCLCTLLSVKMPNLTWTNEVVPIKQGANSAISIFGEWVIAGIFAALFFLIGYKIGAALYLAIWMILLASASFMLTKWLDTKGAELFADL